MNDGRDPYDVGKLAREIASMRAKLADLRELKRTVRILWRAVYGGSVPPPAPRPSLDSSSAIEARELEELRDNHKWWRRKFAGTAIALVVALLVFLAGVFVHSLGAHSP